MNVSPGGVWRLVMHGPDGRDYPNKIVFLEVAKPERLVYKHSGEAGTEPARGAGDWSLDALLRNRK